MGYIIPSDLNRLLQTVNLDQITSGDKNLQVVAELSAITEAKSFLVSKYDTDSEFTNSQVYNPQATYYAGNRIYLDAAYYNSKSTYIPGQLSLRTGIVYQCTTAVTVAEEFDPAKWSALGFQYTIFYANYPYPVFNLTKNYEVGDRVWYKNHVYTCKIATSSISHDFLIQLNNTNQIPYTNIFPDNIKSGFQYWTDGGLYVVPAGNLLTTSPTETTVLVQARPDEYLISGTSPGMVNGLATYTAPALGQIGSLYGWDYSIERIATGTLFKGTDYTKNINGFTLIPFGNVFQPSEKFALHFIPIANVPVPIDSSGVSASQIIMTYFTQGDNRNQQMVLYILDMMIYHMYRRIPPAIVPDIRVKAYQMAVSWLNKVATNDEIQADLPKNQPATGSRIRYGSRPKMNNHY